VGRMIGLDTVGKIKKNMSHCREANLGHPVHSLVAMLTELPRFLGVLTVGN
jgi:hypothetical protein